MGCVCSRLLPGKYEQHSGCPVGSACVALTWQFSEARDRVQARGRDGDGMFPPGQSVRWWSGVGRGVNALPRGSLGRKPTPLQLFVESVVRRGSCKRSQSLGEQGVDQPGECVAWGPGGFPGLQYQGPSLAGLRREEGLAGVLAQRGVCSQHTQEEPGAGT